MPYIESKQVRLGLRLRDIVPDNVGELNYLITFLCHEYVLNHGLYYNTLNDVDGVLGCARTEFQRQVVAKYEDKKRLANGSVSELDAVTLEETR